MADPVVNKNLLNNQKFTLTAAPRNGANLAVSPVLSWSVTPEGKLTIEPAADTLSCLVSSIPGQLGTATVTATASNGVSGSCAVTLQNAEAVSINLSAGPASVI
jgi:hypothetical protein